LVVTLCQKERQVSDMLNMVEQTEVKESNQDVAIPDRGNNDWKKFVGVVVVKMQSGMDCKGGKMG
jgi:hypothetical protein